MRPLLKEHPRRRALSWRKTALCCRAMALAARQIAPICEECCQWFRRLDRNKPGDCKRLLKGRSQRE
jgi:hypothetical protein